MQAILALVDEGRIDEAIVEYDKLNATSKYVEAAKNKQTIRTSIDKLETENDNQQEA